MALKDSIPIFMAFVAVVSLGATVYFGHCQIEHSRVLLSAQLAQEFRRDFDSDQLVKSSSETSAALLKNTKPGDDSVANFFETIGYYVHQGALDREIVYNDFSFYVIHYWPALRDQIRRERHGPDGSADFFVNFEWLNEVMLQEMARRHKQTIEQVTPSSGDVRQFLIDEAAESKPKKRGRRP